MARGVRLPRAAGRPPRFLRTGHRRATSLSEAHLQAARRDAGHTLGREAEGVLHSLLFHRGSRGLRAQRATFRVLAEGDADVDAALASAVACSPPPRSLTPPRPPLSDQRARAARLRRCPDCPQAATWSGFAGLAVMAALRRKRKLHGLVRTVPTVLSLRESRSVGVAAEVLQQLLLRATSGSIGALGHTGRLWILSLGPSTWTPLCPRSRSASRPMTT